MIFTGTSFNNYFTVFSSKVNITNVPRPSSEDVDLTACFYWHHMLLNFCTNFLKRHVWNVCMECANSDKIKESSTFLRLLVPFRNG